MSVSDRLERLPLLRFHFILLVTAGIGWLFDSMDTGIVSFVLPVLMKSWSLKPEQIGLISSIGLIGMAIGAVLAGTIADYFGRKKVFAGTLVLYSLATGLCALAWNLPSLLVFRFFVGFGLGGQLPVAVTLVTEYSPARLRGRFLVLLESFWAVGWLVAAIIAYLVIPKYGWPVAFFIGALPALYVYFIWRKIPESPRYLERTGNYHAAEKIVARLEKEAGIVDNGGTAENPEVSRKEVTGSTKFPLAELWSSRYLRRTVFLWILWFCIVFSYYGIFTWLPAILAAKISLIKSFQFVLIMTIAQIPGYFSAAYLVEKIGRKLTLGSFLALCGFAAFFFGRAAGTGAVLIWGSLMSFFNLGAWGVVYTYTPELYPTRARASGSGWAAGFGRIGGILAPIVVGWMLASKQGTAPVFAMFTGVLLLGALDVAILGEETKGKTLTDLTE
ncbi:MAG TPA: MFS transporter [Desulfobacteria bacterium]|nr:MFS transporter [Desulfobacteria bacterium]